ncbi:MAG: DUF3256 family protein [Bacteroidaceae bacterium]|nr:DUF3256 family protein [Bacteroidaceae bacterium]
MYRIIIAFSLLLSSFHISLQAQTMRDVIKQMPDTILPLLTHGNLLDFPDFLESGMKAEITNKLGGVSEMLIITDDFTAIQLSKSSSVQLKLLPQGRKNILCMVHTYTLNDSISDSQVQFYTTDWKPLKQSKYLALQREENTFVRASVSALNTDLTLQWSYPLTLQFEGEEPRAVTPKKSVLKWNGKKYNQTFH